MQMLRPLLLILLAPLTVASTPSWVAAKYLGSLPKDSVPRAVAVDTGGNIVIAGSIGRMTAGNYSSDGFIAKYAPDGQTPLSFLLLPDSAPGALATDSSGNTYVSGTTTSGSFPITTGAWQTNRGPQGAAFVLKLDGEGRIAYSTFFGGTGAVPYAAAMTVNARGEAFVTGQNGGDLPVSDGGLVTGKTNGLFIVRLSAAGDRILYSIVGVGGTGIAVDSGNNVYTVGGSSDPKQIPITGNAIQDTVPFTICAANRAFAFPCSHQNVAKVNATGTNLLFSTFLSGTYGEGSLSIAVDSHGDIYLSGTTNSSDYPVTAGSFQTRNTAAIPPPPVYHEFFFQGLYVAFPSTGYLTKLAGDGSRILYSTYLGGTLNESAVRVTVDGQGQASVLMRVQSPDLPGLPALPQRCLPDRLHGIPVLVRLNAAGDAIRSATVVEGVGPAAMVVGSFDQTGSAVLLAGNDYLARVADDTPSTGALICMTDQADYIQPAAIAPGQFLNLFGSGMDGGVVRVNGAEVPLLYSSPQQINFAIPYYIAMQPAVIIELTTSAGERASRTLPVVRASPALITLGETGFSTCQGKTVENSAAAVVWNADGTRNSCENPADSGSVVSLFLTGSGVVLPDGIELLDGFGNEVVRVAPVDWMPQGVWRVDVHVHPPNTWIGLTTPATAVALNINGVNVREAPVAVWLK